MTVLELKGYRSLKALNVFNSLMLGLKMLPAYMGESYEDFLSRIQAMPPADQEKMIREAAHFVPLEKDELDSIICFVADPNGVPYGPENIKNLGPAELIEAIVSVCMAIAQIRVDFVTDAEKKKLKNFSVDLRKVFSKKPDATLEEAVNLGFYEAVTSVF